MLRTWLLINESANPDLLNLASSLGLWAQLDFTARPPVTLTWRGDTAVLSTPNARDLFSRVLQASQSPRKRIVAMSTAPATDLRKMHGRVFFASTMHVQISCMAASAADASEPYYRRLVELRFLGSELQGGFDTRGTEVVEAAAPLGDRLFLEPMPLALDAGAVNMVLSDRARSLSLINGVMLPPVREASAGTYFDPTLRQTRQTLADLLGASPLGTSLPAAISAWRTMDDPILRDLLLDGGSLELGGADGEPTTLGVNVWGDGERSEPLADYRARVFLTPSRAPGPEWAKDVARALAGDVADSSPAGPRIERAREAAGWDTAAPPRAFDAGGREQGSWQRLHEIVARLDPRLSRRAVETLQDRVLFPSRSRPGAHADHDLAEREFMRHLWRCPWTAASDAAWRMALLDLFKQEFVGVHPDCAARVQSWASGGQFECRPHRVRPEVVYPSSASLTDVLRWRLTLPLGVVFKPNAQLHLDDTFSKLDRGYQLAS